MPIPAHKRTLGGFVAYMRRDDAERACKAFDGYDWNGEILRTGWGKSITIPLRAMIGESQESCTCGCRRAHRWCRADAGGVQSDTEEQPKAETLIIARSDSSVQQQWSEALAAVQARTLLSLVFTSAALAFAGVRRARELCHGHSTQLRRAWRLVRGDAERTRAREPPVLVPLRPNRACLSASLPLQSH